MKYFWILLLTFSGFNLFSQDVEIKGTVFDDTNGNNLQDQQELGISNVVVSDQLGSTITDENGNFTLKTNDDFPYLFITQPSGYSGKYYYPKAPEMNFPIRRDDKDQNQFKFIHFPLFLTLYPTISTF